MDIEQIRSYLQDSDPQKRMTAVRELRHYDAEVAVPLLIGKKNDSEFLVRSFVAMGLGKKQSAESFACLLETIKCDRDPNVRAEAANSLSYYGEVAVSHLRLMFEQDDNWLVRNSILAAMAKLNCPQELLEVALLGLEGEDYSVRETAIGCLGILCDGEYQTIAMEKLLSLIENSAWRIRLRATQSLAQFDDPTAKKALRALKQDPDHRVVAAALNGLME